MCDFEQKDKTLGSNIWITTQTKKQPKLVYNREKRAILRNMFTHKIFCLVVEINNTQVAIVILDHGFQIPSLRYLKINSNLKLEKKANSYNANRGFFNF